MLSLVVPVYKNEPNLDRLLDALLYLNVQLKGDLEVVLVVDGSPDRCYEILASRLPQLALRSQLLLLSRNFGSFAAITAGLDAAIGDIFAVMAADLQEPPDLILKFYDVLGRDTADVVFGVREGRSDPLWTEFASSLFWGIYRRLVVKDMPRGGVDVFACNRIVRQRLLSFRESNTNLIALLLWMGYRRVFVGYVRRHRLEGKSAWTVGKRLRYCVDSIFNFTDLPVKLLLYLGGTGAATAALAASVVLIMRLSGRISVAGYTPVVIAILFFGSLTSIGLGIIGQYVWLALQNTRGRPHYIVASSLVLNDENLDDHSEIHHRYPRKADTRA